MKASDDLPDDATAHEIVEQFLHIGRTMKPVGQWPGERVYKAIERIMNQPHNFITPEDRAPERYGHGRVG